MLDRVEPQRVEPMNNPKRRLPGERTPSRSGRRPRCSGIAEHVQLHPDASHTGDRLDVFLAAELPDFSRNFVQQLIAEGNVLVDGIERKRTFKVTAGTNRASRFRNRHRTISSRKSCRWTLSMRMPTLPSSTSRPEWLCIPPPDMPMARSSMDCWPAIPEIAINGTNRPGIVHRLDKDTSGLIVIARTPPGQKLLLEQWADGSVQKGYKALVHGLVEPNEATIDAPIGRDPTDRQRMAVDRLGQVGGNAFHRRGTLRRGQLPRCRDRNRPHPSDSRSPRIHRASGRGRSPLCESRRAPTLGLERQFLHAWRLGLRLSRRPPRDFRIPAAR